MKIRWIAAYRVDLPIDETSYERSPGRFVKVEIARFDHRPWQFLRLDGAEIILDKTT